MLREKIVAQASKREIIVVDERKLSDKLGTNFYLPVEVIQFGMQIEFNYLTSLGGNPQLRKTTDDTPLITDEGNYILDCHFGPIQDAVELSNLLNKRAGIVEHGLFIDLADEVIVAGQDGIKHLIKS